jgi:hypothetical protein
MRALPLLLIISVFVISCQGKPFHAIRLDKLQIEMTKEQVSQELGSPYNMIGSKKFPKGLIEVWEYRKYSWMDQRDLDEIYWLYFLNNKLEQWGRPGDWSIEADRIYEIRFR